MVGDQLYYIAIFYCYIILGNQTVLVKSLPIWSHQVLYILIHLIHNFGHSTEESFRQDCMPLKLGKSGNKYHKSD